MKLPVIEKMQLRARKWARVLQLDTDRSYLLEFGSDGNLHICGIRDIRSYDETDIVVLSEKLVTEIKGRGLYMLRFSDTEISVSGEILSVNFIRR